MNFALFGTGLVLLRFYFGYILAPNQVEPKALALESKLTGNFRYQNTEVAVLLVFSVLDQHYLKLFCLNADIIKE